jgi:DNA-binding MarR family transcriptional regulator
MQSSAPSARRRTAAGTKKASAAPAAKRAAPPTRGGVAAPENAVAAREKDAKARATRARAARADLDESLGFLIAEAERASKRVLFARLAGHGVRRGGWFILRALRENEGITQREIAQRLGLLETSVLEMVRALEADGLVTRTRDDADRRRIRIHLTDAGRAVQPILQRVAAEVNRLMAKDLGEAEAVLLKLLLRKVRASLADA